ncbi:uncharacterized protein LOC100689988 [Oreochromis niloticus]|uniref:Uncharacterized LOC100689988 n=1 Tax=Oreochromis niloticus TaxID=8128 RepID=I3JJQ8_ORENI|nr:uncharacterized protein LOC100689988 [Oreochromis niloticus]XP_019212687.1 uncharacterized protein LOC100689988 [Oreochromis niloticus]XP_019212688.1 uncharacterized protein LOC100689988 [Oreochromis niloticus]
MATQNTNISSKYDDIVSRSIRMYAGPPAIYQLRPKKEKFGTLTKMTVGEKNPNKTNKTILLVGETGAGKSTLINALFNYSMGVKFEDEVWFQIVEKETGGDCQSQTTDVIVYEIFGFEDETLPYSLTIIDTPGYGDTKGIERDVIVSQRLFDLFRSEDGVHEVHAVGLVMKASENRLSDRQRYIFDSVMSLFGKDLEKNIVALITHSDGRRPKNALKALNVAKLKCATNKKNEPVHFLFDNCQDEDRTEDELDELKHSYDVTEKGMYQWMDFITGIEPQQLGTTVDVLNTRITLIACFNNLQQRIELIDLKHRKIQQAEEVLKKYEEDLKKDENFTVEVDEIYKEKEPVAGGIWWYMFFEGAVCCTVCEENCHYPGCTMAWKPEQCEVMKDGCCIVCTNRCHASHHVKEKCIYVTKTRKVKKTMEMLKKTYEVKQQENMTLLMVLKKQKEEHEVEKNHLLDEAYQHVVKLQQIALNVNSVSTHIHLDLLIEKMEEKGDTGKVQKLLAMRSGIDEGVQTMLRYCYGKLTSAGKAVREVLNYASSQQTETPV